MNMVSGQILPKMKRRELSIFITFPDTYTALVSNKLTRFAFKLSLSLL